MRMIVAVPRTMEVGSVILRVIPKPRAEAGETGTEE